MKMKSLVLIALCAAIPALACAKKPKVEAQPQQEAEPVVEEEAPVITEECLMKISLFNENVKNKQFADAYQPWWEVYNECPNANKVIYSAGPKIIEYMYGQADRKSVV